MRVEFFGMRTMRLSALEVPLVNATHSMRAMLAGAVQVARSLEATGYERVWYAEHHSSVMFAAVPPSVLATHVGASTSTIRVGSGGVLALNHSPLSLAEQFGALASIQPGRVEIGIGRGPGSLDPADIRDLRQGTGEPTAEEYRQRVAAILSHLDGRPDIPQPWLLASSPSGAALAAELGLPLVFAYHIRPRNAAESLALYRQRFRPSPWAELPHALLCVDTICAETGDEAAELALPWEIHEITSLPEGVDRPLLDVRDAAARIVTPDEDRKLAELRQYKVRGTAERVSARLAELADELAADGLMVFTPVADWRARAKSFDLLSRAFMPDRVAAT